MKPLVVVSKKWNWERCFILGFSLTLLLSASGLQILSRFAYYGVSLKNVFGFAECRRQRFSVPLVDDVHYPGLAKARQEFWATTLDPMVCGEFGVGLKALTTPAIFSAMFPGYTDTLVDRELWTRYFSYAFNIDSWQRIAGDGLFTEFLVNESWQGNTELFRKYGADIVLVGSSQTYRNTVPKILADHLARFFPNHPPKTLMLSAPNFNTESIRRMADNLSRSGHKAKVLLLGYSQRMAFLRSQDRRDSIEILNSQWHYEEPSHLPQLRSLFPPPDWRTLWGFNIADYINVFKRPILLNEDPSSGSPTFARSLLDQPEKLRRLANNIQPAFSGFVDMTAADCDLENAGKDLEATVASLKKIAEKIIIYIPPATPYFTNASVACFYPAFISAVQKPVDNKSVFALTLGWRDYELDWEDFAYPTPDIGALQIDLFHATEAGAEKITTGLAKSVAKIMEYQEPFSSSGELSKIILRDVNR